MQGVRKKDYALQALIVPEEVLYALDLAPLCLITLCITYTVFIP